MTRNNSKNKWTSNATRKSEKAGKAIVRCHLSMGQKDIPNTFYNKELKTICLRRLLARKRLPVAGKSGIRSEESSFIFSLYPMGTHIFQNIYHLLFILQLLLD